MVFLRLKRLLHLPENVADNNPWPELYLNDGEYPVARVQHNMINAQDGVGGFRLVFKFNYIKYDLYRQ